MTADELHCVCFGAGGLGLGFLGPELAPECRITYVDVPEKAPFLDQLRRRGEYVLNLTGLSMRPVRVGGVEGVCLGEETREEVLAALAEADLVFTAVGAANLPALAPAVAAALSRRSPANPLRVLCGENGVQIARSFRAAVESEAEGPAGEALRVGDTVMGRMCKVVADPQPPLQPPAPGLDWAVVAEPFYGIPVEQHAVAGMGTLPAAIEPHSAARFRACEDVKMLAHNGLHATLACLGYLRGALFFDELRADAELMEHARRLLIDEAGAALLRRHGAALGRNRYFNYCDAILRRVTCPVLHDSVERGVRGIMRKLEPWERLVYSVRTVAEAGVEPRAFATGLAAAVTVARRTGETEQQFRRVLTEHCGFEPEEDAALIDLIEGCRAAMVQEL